LTRAIALSASARLLFVSFRRLEIYGERNGKKREKKEYKRMVNIGKRVTNLIVLAKDSVCGEEHQR
jgi:hypothetical protein